MGDFTHYSEDGRATMVDISEKKISERIAKARGFVQLQKVTIEKILNQTLPKGDIFEIARIAGIMAAKNTSQLIPLCHQLLLNHVDVLIKLDEEKKGVVIESEVRLTGKTGAEMEALTAVSIAALTVYDMCKAVDKEITINDVILIEKQGGKSDYKKLL